MFQAPAVNTIRTALLSLSFIWACGAAALLVACGDEAGRSAGDTASTTPTDVDAGSESDAATEVESASDAAADLESASDAPTDAATTPPTDVDASRGDGDETVADVDAADLADASPPVPPCPAITVAEGLEVVPPVTLHLSGLGSTGDVATWKWTATAPDGLVSVLVPGTGVAEPRFEAALAGTYRFTLEARGNKGEMACEAAEVEVVARPGPGIHLELVWDDNTADPTLEVGADLDLHVFRHDAVGLDTDEDGSGDGWFDPLYDCAWHNPDPVWPAPEGAANPAPRLVRRDDAGYGPEVIVVPAPEATTYVVGFHVWDDEDAVYLQPTEIRVWIDGVLKNKPSFAVPVKAPSLERVMTVTWPSGQLGFPFADDGDFIPPGLTKSP